MSFFLDLRRTLLALPVLALVLAAAYVLFLSDDGTDIEAARLLPPQASLDEGKTAPDFEVSTSDGDRVRLSDLRGRAVLVNFWATWCGSCLAEMPDIRGLQEEKGPQRLAVLAVNAGQTLEKAREFIDFLDAPHFTYGLDPTLTVTDAYGVYGLPLSVFIDAQGTVRAVYNGHANRERLDAYITAALNAAPPPELPVLLRPISTIPRENIIYVTRSEKGRLELQGRTLRCDAGYCPQASDWNLPPGIHQAHFVMKGDDRRLEVRYDGMAIAESVLIDAIVSGLQSRPDPVYGTEIEVRRSKP